MFCLSNPILFWLVNPTVAEVDGDMYFGINFSVLIGKIILGKESFISAPTSELLKNRLELSPASFEEPTLPFAVISKISALLNTFLMENEALKPIPNCWMVEVKASKSTPSEYFFRGVNNTVAINPVPVVSEGSSI